MTEPAEIEVWVRGTQHATTRAMSSIATDANAWTDTDVMRLLSEMLRALERAKNPGGETPAIALRGFSWIVSAYEKGGVLVHLEMQMGTASAGPFTIDERRLTEMIGRVMAKPADSESVH